MRWHETVDIGIVGAGGCGLVAAHAAAQDGASITVWDKAATAGGNTALSCGMVPAAGSRLQREAGIFETGEDFVRDVLARNGGRSDPALTRRLCESSAALVEWLVDARGVQLELVKQVCDPGHSRARLHAPPSRRGQTVIDGLLRSLERRRITLRLGAPVLQLWTDDTGAVVGVQVKRPRKTPTNVRCSKLILATDGFGANPELVAQHCQDATGLAYAGAATSDGAALVWATDIGAGTQHLGAYHAYPSVALGSNQMIPWELVGYGAVLVNQRGERFADEAQGPAALVATLRAQPGRVAYEILDARIMNLGSADDPRFAADVVPRAVRRAGDVEALAKQFQIDPATLVHTLTVCNEARHASGETSGAPVQPLSAPFYGIRVTAALLETQGGLTTDTSARVLRPDGSIIPNLYAGGGAVAGLSGPGGDGYLLGNGLLCAFGWGRIAGEQAAHEILAARASAPREAPPHPPEGEPATE